MNLLKITIYISLFCVISTKSYSNYSDTSNNCDKIKEIKSSIYKENFVQAQTIKLFDKFQKKKGELTIPTKRKTIKFVDEFQDKEPIKIFTVFGQIKTKNWIVVKELGLNNETYYLVNISTSQIDTLVGEPKMFKDEIVCIEGSYTDSPEHVEVYLISKDEINLKFRISLTKCNLFAPQNLYLKDNKIFLSDNNKAWTINYK